LVLVAIIAIPTFASPIFASSFEGAALENITARLIAAEGYPYEEYNVHTHDRYILKVFRIPGSAKSPPAPGKPVVFLQHGLLSSSADWLALGKDRAIPYLLADEGFDVWLGNARGNTQSRKHETLNPDWNRDFWDFDWHEIGTTDLPAMIDFTLWETGQRNLHYIGHSQGTTSFFVMASERREMNAKIKTMHAFAPVAFMSNLKSPMLRLMAPFVDQAEWVMKMLGVYEFLPSNELMIDGGKLICKDESPLQEVCANVLFLLCGYNSEQLDRSLLPTILENTPAGASVNQIAHYAHGINSGKFRQFDHGLVENLFRYGSLFPPEYNLKFITAPVFLHYSDNDWMAAVKDVDELSGKLGNLVMKNKVPDPKFNHLDFLFAKEADILLYNYVIELIKHY